LEDTETLVLVDVAGGEERLRADDAITPHLGLLTDLVVDQPVSRPELRPARRHVLDPNVIREHESPVLGDRLHRHIVRADGDADARSQAIEEGSWTHASVRID